MLGVTGDDDYDGWVRLLADPSRVRPAFWHLVNSGQDALDSVRRGLESPNDDVRRWSTKVLDHLADQASFETLVSMLDDPNPQVHVEACHALACDNCKDNSSRPDPSSVLPSAIDVLLHDPDRHVRAYAAEVVGRWVHSYADAETALIRARDHDPEPAVRKNAQWYAPGGTIHRKTAPRPQRQPSAPAS